LICTFNQYNLLQLLPQHHNASTNLDSSVTYAVEFIIFAIQFVGFAIEFISFAAEFFTLELEFVAYEHWL